MEGNRSSPEGEYKKKSWILDTVPCNLMLLRIVYCVQTPHAPSHRYNNDKRCVAASDEGKRRLRRCSCRHSHFVNRKNETRGLRCYVTAPSGSLAHAAGRKLKKDRSDNDYASFCLTRRCSNEPACLDKSSSPSSSWLN